MFRNRGSVPHINVGSNTNNNTNTIKQDRNEGYNVPHYSNYWNGRFIIIQYDKSFVAIEIVSVLIILLTIFSVYLFAYEFHFYDPIAKLKSNFLNAQLISIIVSIVSAILFTFFTKKSKKNLIRNLRIVAIISIIAILTFLIIKLNLNEKYTETTFQTFYQLYEEPNNKENKDSTKVSVGLSGVKISDPKEAYVYESKNSYNIFSIKVILYTIVYLAFVIILFYLTHRLTTIESKKEQLAKDDEILYDEEENVKF